MTKATCKSCGADIIYATTMTGKTMPIDVEPSPKGNLVVIDGFCRVANDADQGRPLYLSHFATCPDAPLFRHAKEKKEKAGG
jgi:hypothetical protein